MTNETPTPRTDAIFEPLNIALSEWTRGKVYQDEVATALRKALKDTGQLERELAEANARCAKAAATLSPTDACDLELAVQRAVSNDKELRELLAKKCPNTVYAEATNIPDTLVAIGHCGDTHPSYGIILCSEHRQQLQSDRDTQRARADKAEAACAEMRAWIDRQGFEHSDDCEGFCNASGNFLSCTCGASDFNESQAEILAKTTIGTGWHSPEEWDKMKDELESVRSAYSFMQERASRLDSTSCELDKQLAAKDARIAELSKVAENAVNQLSLYSMGCDPEAEEVIKEFQKLTSNNEK